MPDEKPSAYVLGGNSTTLAFVSGAPEDASLIDIWLVPLAWTPAGVVLGEGWQKVGVATSGLAEWVDQTFSPDDERAFVTPVRELELLLRIGWHATPPEALREDALLNPHDLPEDVLDATHIPPTLLVQCPICRRTCVRDDFVWNERRLCAWDFHTSVLGKRGPWRGEAYEERLFETLPRPAYVVPELLEELGVDIVMHTVTLDETIARQLINTAISSASGSRAHMAVRTASGYTLLQERR